MTARALWQYSSAARAVGALLCLAVTYVHLEDQSFFAFDKGPRYVLIGYLILEVVGIITGVLLVVRPARSVWAVAALVALGPMIGYVLSRGPGLPGYSDDRGNWSEPLGVISLVIEAVLLVMAVAAMGRRGGRAVAGATRADSGRAEAGINR